MIDPVDLPDRKGLWLKRVAIVVVLGAVAAAFAISDYQARDVNAELIRVARAVSVGDSRQKVTKVLEGMPERFRVAGAGESQVRVATPERFGAMNWLLIIEFGHGEVICIRFGSNERPDVPPPGAPDNRGVCAPDLELE